VQSLGLDNDGTLRLLRVINLVKLRRRPSPGGASPLEKRISLKSALSGRLASLHIGDGGAGVSGSDQTTAADSNAVGGLAKLAIARQNSDVSSVGKHRSVRFSSLDNYDENEEC
jgi:hypothetical protein